jgi:hypothetical protein
MLEVYFGPDDDEHALYKAVIILCKEGTCSGMILILILIQASPVLSPHHRHHNSPAEPGHLSRTSDALTL